MTPQHLPLAQHRDTNVRMVTYGNIWSNWHGVRLSKRDIGWLFGVSPSRLTGWKQTEARVSIALSSTPGSVLRTTDVVLGTTELEQLVVAQSTLRLARTAALRLTRREMWVRERARLAGEMVRAAMLARAAGPERRGQWVSWADAVLARAAVASHQTAQETPGTAIATNGSGHAGRPASVEPGASESVGREVWDKRRLRGAERARVFAELRAARVARASKQGGGTTGGVVGAPGPPKRRASARVYSPPLQTLKVAGVLDAQSDSAQGGPGQDRGIGGSSPVGACPIVASKSSPKGCETASHDRTMGRHRPPVHAPAWKFQQFDGSYFKPTPGRPKSVKQEVLAAPMESLPADFVFPSPPVASVLDASVALTYTEVMVDEPVPVVVDGKCPECGMRLQRGWCGRCRVRWAAKE